ncbi:MAG: O-antigen ligase family protein [Chloroflexota bacterium]|nr:O-antigen ligase family protein [Chloroflexota bacterium]
MDSWLITAHDFITATPLHWILHSRHRWLATLFTLLLIVVSGIGGSWLLAKFGIIPLVALLLVGGYALFALRNIEVAYWGVMGLVTLLPFASLPFSIGFTPTFLDLALLGLFFIWLAPLILGQRKLELISTPLDGPIAAFALLAVGAFVMGLSYSPLTSYLIRHFAEVLMSIGLFFLVTHTVTTVGRLERLTRVFLLLAGGAALLGIILYAIPDALAMQALSALGRVGYPVGGGVLRYIRDDPALMQRATSTSVDPNVLGSLLNLALAIALPQLFTSRPVFKRSWLIPLIGLLGLCLGLTVSRGSMVGAVAAIGLLGIMRYRKIFPPLLLLLILILLLPCTQGYIAHFVEGVQGEDLSTKMRFGEYKDAFTLIGRHPLLGVGFGGTPDIDTYLGVASIYLLIAEQTGLLGLASFLLIVGSLLYRFGKHWYRKNFPPPELEPFWYGYHSAVVGGLVGGIFDHYFFSLDFHHSVTIFWLILALATVTTQLFTVNHHE